MEEFFLNTSYISKYNKINMKNTITLILIGIYVLVFWLLLILKSCGMVIMSKIPYTLICFPIWFPLIGICVLFLYRWWNEKVW